MVVKIQVWSRSLATFKTSKILSESYQNVEIWHIFLILGYIDNNCVIALTAIEIKIFTRYTFKFIKLWEMQPNYKNRYWGQYKSLFILLSFFLVLFINMSIQFYAVRVNVTKFAWIHNRLKQIKFNSVIFLIRLKPYFLSKSF